MNVTSLRSVIELWVSALKISSDLRRHTYVEDKRKGHLSIPILRQYIITGLPKQEKDSVRIPAWQRSPHITQGWSVMDSADGALVPYRHGYKVSAMRTKVPLPERKGGSCDCG